jgi:hypothetical protein
MVRNRCVLERDTITGVKLGSNHLEDRKRRLAHVSVLA